MFQIHRRLDLHVTKFRSLHVRLLGPIVACAIIAAAAVAIGSYILGLRSSTAELESRLAAIQQTIAGAAFPLNERVLKSLAGLTRTELVTLDADGEILQSTIDFQLPERRPISRSLALIEATTTGNRQYIVLTHDADRLRAYRVAMPRGPLRSDEVASVVVIFDAAMLETQGRRAAMLPLATGLSTIIVLSSVMLALSTRLVRRISALQRRVDAVAEGDFDSSVSDSVGDELGQLGESVDSMARQLSKLWATVNQQQGVKLLHQIAGGMAHQLRNSLTGARMAIELHEKECPASDDKGIPIAIHQIEQAEDYVRRLLLVASGRQDEDRPATLRTCWQDVQTSLSPIAEHHNIELEWSLDEGVAEHVVSDGPTWVAAVSNLVHNALQAGDNVRAHVSQTESQKVRVLVSDNGPGVSEMVAETLFDPFVSTRPEGLGLGLPVVRRAAEYFDGDLQWYRADNRTVFEFDFTCQNPNHE